MSRIYVNENFPLPVVATLRHLRHDVLTSFEAGNANKRIPDEKVLEFAIADQRIMLTLNRRDFVRLHKMNPIHHGILSCTEDTDFQALAARIHNVLLENNDILENQLVKIYKPA